MMKNLGYAVTALFCAMMAFGGVMQVTLNEQAVMVFNRLMINNTATMQFLGLMKLAGVVGMWVPRGRTWAIHGFTFLFCGALATHWGAGDPMNQFMGPAMGLCLLGCSTWLWNKGQKTTKSKSSSTSTKRKAA